MSFIKEVKWSGTNAENRFGYTPCFGKQLDCASGLFSRVCDPEILYKIIDDYYSELPLYEIYRLFYKLVETADDAVFQHALDYLFSQNIT